MELREYLSIRRAYNLVRQDIDGPERLSFSEFAILCRLDASGGSYRTSEIAEYQSSLRPTMTHRTKHLEELGFIERIKGGIDKRNVICVLTDTGAKYVNKLCAKTRKMIPSNQALRGVSVARMRHYIDTMGSLPIMSKDLILIGLYAGDYKSCNVAVLVNALGLLQPTVSMSIASLVHDGFLSKSEPISSSRSVQITLTEKGVKEAAALAEQIEALTVRKRANAKRASAS